MFYNPRRASRVSLLPTPSIHCAEVCQEEMDEDDVSRPRRPTGRSRSMSDEDDVLRVRRRRTGRSRSVDKINSHVREPGTTDLRENFYGPRETSLGLIDGVACSETISQDESSSRPDYIYTDLNDNDEDQGFYEGFYVGLYEDEDEDQDEDNDEDEDQGFDEDEDQGFYEDEDQGFDEDEDQGFYEDEGQGFDEDEDQGFDEGLFEDEYEEEMDKDDEEEEMEEHEYEEEMEEYAYDEEMQEHEYEEVMDEHEYEEMEEMDEYEDEEEMVEVTREMLRMMMMMIEGVTPCSPDLRLPSNLETILWDESLRPHDVPLQELKQITDNFSDNRILGQGGFGVVYKGVLPNGETIAVKKIMSSLMPNQQKQFESEVYHLMMLKHPNIVRFVGYCYEIKNACLEYDGEYVFAEMAEKLLCFEYLPKGSLDKYLSDESSGLDWSTRYKIIDGICNGLWYLHEQIEKPIIHLDLKPANILLDDGMVPKITDFGLSRLLGQQETNCTSSRIGTFGYMAKEFLERGTITPKLDIFSLGVIILEVITGHREYPDVTTTPSDDFIKLTLEKWRNVLQRSASYGSLETDCEQIKRCLRVGLICVDTDRTKRPPVAKVIRMLQGLESIDCDISNDTAA